MNVNFFINLPLGQMLQGLQLKCLIHTRTKYPSVQKFLDYYHNTYEPFKMCASGCESWCEYFIHLSSTAIQLPTQAHKSHTHSKYLIIDNKTATYIAHEQHK